MDNFKRVLVVCAAASTFAAVGTIGLSGVAKLFDSRVRQVTSSESETAEVASSFVERARKAVASLIR